MSTEVTGQGGVRGGGRALTCSSGRQLQTDHPAAVAAYFCIQLRTGELPQTLYLSVCLLTNVHMKTCNISMFS